MRRGASLRMRATLVTGLAMLALWPSAAHARWESCGFAFTSYKNPVVRGGQGTFSTWGAGVDNGYLITLTASSSWFTVVLASGQASGSGEIDETFTIPADFPLGAATLGVSLDSSNCFWSASIEVKSGVIVGPGVTVVPGVTTSSQATTTTISPTPATNATSTTTTTSEASATTGSSTTTVPPSSTTTNATEAEPSDETTTTDAVIVAAPVEPSSGGQPWSAWLLGGLVGFLLGAASMLAAIRKRLFQV